MFFSILVNDIPSQPFTLNRGIRQGDPLSPFLFFIMDEGLGYYIKESIQNGSLKGLNIHGLQPTNLQSQFVDDTIILNTPTTQEANKLISILNYFNESSIPSFNLDKYQLFLFSTPIVVQQHISRMLNIPICSLPCQYLGLPLSYSTTRNIS
jgi:hypothetical protein